MHHLLFKDVPVCTAYLYWHMSTSGKHAPPTLSSCQQEGSMRQLSFTDTPRQQDGSMRQLPFTDIPCGQDSFTCMFHGCKHKEFQYNYKLSLTAINKCQCSHWYSNWWLAEIITDSSYNCPHFTCSSTI
jgi:hypothetical protein